MRWADKGIVLGGRPFGETSVIAEIFTCEHGRTFGLVKGGRSRRNRPLLQAGNILDTEWRARLDDQLGVFTVELVRSSSALVWDDPRALAALNTLAAHLQVLPERDPHRRLYEAAAAYLEHAAEPGFAARLVRFELLLLDELGFGLELRSCAATGTAENLVYVSPRSGQAVSSAAGAPYRDKLLRLPAFIKGADVQTPHDQDIADGFALTGHFLKQHVFEPQGWSLPQARNDLLHLMARHSERLSSQPAPAP